MTHPKKTAIISALLAIAMLLSATVPVFASVVSDPKNYIYNKWLDDPELREMTEQMDALDEQIDSLYDERDALRSNFIVYEYMYKELASDEEYSAYKEKAAVLDTLIGDDGNFTKSAFDAMDDIYNVGHTLISKFEEAAGTNIHPYYVIQQSIQLALQGMNSEQSPPTFRYAFQMYSYYRMADSCPTQKDAIQAMAMPYFDKLDACTNNDEAYAVYAEFSAILTEMKEDSDGEDVSENYVYSELFEVMNGAYTEEAYEEYDAFANFISQAYDSAEEKLYEETQEKYDRLTEEIDRLENEYAEFQQKYDEARAKITDSGIEQWLKENYGEYSYYIPDLQNCDYDCHGLVNGWDDEKDEPTFAWRYVAETETLYLNNCKRLTSADYQDVNSTFLESRRTYDYSTHQDAYKDIDVDYIVFADNIENAIAPSKHEE